ncbi:MAG: GNAT family N-acetyltransferase [Deltaproteobacteria bacterium]|nr:GNAT family N-acetyltransferase [Deltaproteobacteria bacterium]
MRAPEILETDRLRLRRPLMEDAAVIFAQYAQDQDVTRYLTWRPHRTIEETYEFLRDCPAGWEAGKLFQWGIVRKQDGQFLGMIAVRVDGHKWELGYVLARTYWGNGYMTEAVKGVIDWALKQPGIYRVWAVCDIENAASARVLEKAGMEREGLLRRWSIHPNVSDEPRDSYCYAITKGC